MSERGLYEDPELYDLLFPAAKDLTFAQDEARKQLMIASEQFYLREAVRGGGPVLELGCGSGRLTLWTRCTESTSSARICRVRWWTRRRSICRSYRLTCVISIWPGNSQLS
jgi:hypothetical protein